MLNLHGTLVFVQKVSFSTELPGTAERYRELFAFAGVSLAIASQGPGEHDLFRALKDVAHTILFMRHAVLGDLRVVKFWFCPSSAVMLTDMHRTVWCVSEMQVGNETRPALDSDSGRGRGCVVFNQPAKWPTRCSAL